MMDGYDLWNNGCYLNSMDYFLCRVIYFSCFSLYRIRKVVWKKHTITVLRRERKRFHKKYQKMKNIFMCLWTKAVYKRIHLKVLNLSTTVCDAVWNIFVEEGNYKKLGQWRLQKFKASNLIYLAYLHSVLLFYMF